MGLEELTNLLHNDKSSFFNRYIAGDQVHRQTVRKIMNPNDFVDLVNYVWERIWQPNGKPIPELISLNDLDNSIGRGVYKALNIRDARTTELLSLCIADYGVFDDRKMQVYIQMRDLPSRLLLQAAFFSRGNRVENAIKLMNYCWDKEWKSEQIPILELVTTNEIRNTIGSAIYPALGIEKDLGRELLQRIFPDYGTFNEDKMAVYLSRSTHAERTILGNAFFSDPHAAQNAAKLVNYTWDKIWSSEKVIPELVTLDDVNESLGITIYEPLGISTRDCPELLRACIKDYGVFDDQKIRTFTQTSERNVRKTLTKAFFEGPQAANNAKKLVNYIWSNVLKSDQIPIPELVSHNNLKKLVGQSPYEVLDIDIGSSPELLRICIQDYGVFNDDKLKVYVQTKVPGKREILARAFLSGPNKEDNVNKLVNYVWKNVWSSEMAIPELIGSREADSFLGPSAYDALAIAEGGHSRLLQKCIDKYGILSDDKAVYLIGCSDLISIPSRTRLYRVFFGTENPDREKNAQKYIDIYQQRLEKRKSDFSEEDFDNLPSLVREVLGIQTISDLRAVPHTSIPETRSSYNVVQINWTKELESTLAGLLANQENPAAFIKNNPDLIWQNLGTTSFAAHMKAQEMGIIPETVIFGIGEKISIPTYPLIEFDGYPFKEYALSIAKNIAHATEVDTHLFVSPVHGQNFHVNIPINYKGVNLEEYIEREKAILKSVSLYLRDPNQFEKIRRIASTRKSQETVWEYQTPDININPRIVPTRADGQLLAQVILPVRYSADRAGIFTGVLSTIVDSQKFNIYLFQHRNVGRISS